jgi:hypothetical protein
MARSAIDKIPSGPQLDALTAQKVLAGRTFTSTKVRLLARSGIRLVTLAISQGALLFDHPVRAYLIEGQMKQIGRLDRYQKELSKITHAKNVLLSEPPRINVAGQRSKLWGSTDKSFH